MNEPWQNSEFRFFPTYEHLLETGQLLSLKMSELSPLLPQTHVDETHESSEEDSERTKSKNTLLGMLCVALGVGFFTTVGALVQNHGGSVLQIMEGE